MNSQVVFPTFLLLLYVTALQGDHKLQTTSLILPTMERDYDYAQIGLFKRKDVGKTKCQNYEALYSNASVPEYCTNKPCNAYIGGKGGKKQKTPTAFMINQHLATVRVHATGHSTRTFVSIGVAKKASYQFPIYNNSRTEDGVSLTYLGNLWQSTPCYPTLSYVIGTCVIPPLGAVTCTCCVISPLGAVTMHRGTYYIRVRHLEMV